MQETMCVQRVLNLMMQWPKGDFPLHELLRSTAALHQKLDNLPTPEQAARLRSFVELVLQPLRDEWGDPLVVASGYRSEDVNQRVGGVSTSYHLCERGAAVDVHPIPRSRESVIRLLRVLKDSSIPFAEAVVYPFGPRLHIGWDVNFAQNKREILMADGKTYRVFVWGQDDVA